MTLTFKEFMEQQAEVIELRESANQRTKESIHDALLDLIASCPLVSGHYEFGDALIKVTRAACEDVPFDSALNEISITLLELFPNKDPNPEDN